MSDPLDTSQPHIHELVSSTTTSSPTPLLGELNGLPTPDSQIESIQRAWAETRRERDAALAQIEALQRQQERLKDHFRADNAALRAQVADLRKALEQIVINRQADCGPCDRDYCSTAPFEKKCSECVAAMALAPQTTTDARNEQGDTQTQEGKEIQG